VNTKATLVTFGGAYTVLPYLREQTVDRYGWLNDRQVIDGLALGETTPGPLISVGIFLSYLAARLPGAIVGCFFLFLPSFVLVLGLGRYVGSARTTNAPRYARARARPMASEAERSWRASWTRRPRSGAARSSGSRRSS